MPELTEHEALVALNQLRSNMVATQQASWSNMCYPIVAILNAAGFELIEEVTEQQAAEHLNCYGGGGGYPGHLKEPPPDQAHCHARRILRERAELRKKMRGSDAA